MELQMLHRMVVLCFAFGALLLAGCGGEDKAAAPAAPEKPTVVTEADLNKKGDFWVRLTPDLKDELIDAGKQKLGGDRPDGASNITAIDGDKLVEEMDKQYSNVSKRTSTIYSTYVVANDAIALDTFNELVPQLEEGG